MTSEERVLVCAQVREKAALVVREVLRCNDEPTELGFTEALGKEIEKSDELYERGWYDPPSGGAAALFASPASFERLLFDSLRKKEFWPSSGFRLQTDGIGFIYLSPVHRETGIIGDFALTIYLGHDPKIEAHLQRCLSLIEEVAEFAEVGMELREVHDFAQGLLLKKNLSNKRTLTLTDLVGTNIGHTIPWTYEDPTEDQHSVIAGGNFDTLKELISKKRVNLNREERFRIPATIAFTVELRIEDPADPTLPNVYYHLVVSFLEGKKSVHANFNEIFGETGMNSYIVSTF